jgi:hypothetical protein
MPAAAGMAGSAQQEQRGKKFWAERVMDHLSQGANAPTAKEGTSFTRTKKGATIFLKSIAPRFPLRLPIGSLWSRALADRKLRGERWPSCRA